LIEQEEAEQVVLGGRQVDVGARLDHCVGVVVEPNASSSRTPAEAAAAPVRRRIASIRATSSSRLIGFST
jgi:hypothetical protein